MTEVVYLVEPAVESGCALQVISPKELGSFFSFFGWLLGRSFRRAPSMGWSFSTECSRAADFESRNLCRRKCVAESSSGVRESAISGILVADCDIRLVVGFSSQRDSNEALPPNRQNQGSGEPYLHQRATVTADP